MKCHFCNKEIDATKPYIQVTGMDGTKYFCPGPIGILSRPEISAPRSEADKTFVSLDGLCSQVYKMEQLMKGGITIARLINPIN